MPTRRDPKALAALTLVESLIMSLRERGMVNPEDVDDVFENALDVLRDSEDPPTQDAYRLLKRIHSGGNSFRFDQR